MNNQKTFRQCLNCKHRSVSHCGKHSRVVESLFDHCKDFEHIVVACQRAREVVERV